MAQSLADRDLFDTIFKMAPDGIVIIDPDERVVAINEAAANMTGWSLNDFVDRPLTCAEVLQCADKEGNILCGMECFAKAATLHQPVPYAEVNLQNRKTGRRLPVSASSTQIRVGGREYTAMMLRDISERRALEDRVQALLEETRRQRDRARLLNRLGSTLAGILMDPEAVASVLRGLGSALGARWTATATATVPDGDVEWQGVRLEKEKAEWGRWHTAGWSSLDQPREGLRLLWPEEGDGFQSVALHVEPLPRRGEIQGLLVLAGLERELGEEERLLVASLTNQLSVALYTAHLYRHVEELATLEERARIAREMHDGMAQYLGYVNLQLASLEHGLKSGLESARLQEQLAEARRVVKEAYAEARHTIFDLKHDLTSAGSFQRSLQDYVNEYAEIHGLETRLEGDVAVLDRLPRRAQAQVHRVVQEALANVRKHAKARSVEVSCRADDTVVVIRVADDGRGFSLDENGAQGHYGLAIMRERAAAVGGKLRISSRPGEGTEVVLEVPLGGKESEDEAAPDCLSG